MPKTPSPGLHRVCKQFWPFYPTAYCILFCSVRVDYYIGLQICILQLHFCHIRTYMYLCHITLKQGGMTAFLLKISSLCRCRSHYFSSSILYKFMLEETDRKSNDKSYLTIVLFPRSWRFFVGQKGVVIPPLINKTYTATTLTIRFLKPI